MRHKTDAKTGVGGDTVDWIAASTRSTAMYRLSPLCVGRKEKTTIRTHTCTPDS